MKLKLLSEMEKKCVIMSREFDKTLCIKVSRYRHLLKTIFQLT